MTIAKGSYACIVDSPIIMPHYIVNTKNRIPIAKCFTLEVEFDLPNDPNNEIAAT